MNLPGLSSLTFYRSYKARGSRGGKANSWAQLR